MTHVLRRLVPKRISSQIVVLMLTALILAQGLSATAVLVLYQRPNLMSSPFADITRLAYTAKLVDAAPDADARAIILRAAQAAFPRLTREVRMPDPAAPNEGMLRELRTELGERFTAFVTRPADGRDQPDPPQIGVWLTDGSAIAIPMPPPRGTPVPPGLIGTLVFVASALALLSIWAVRVVSAPLRRFADAAELFTVGAPDVPLAEQGPLEIQRAARALNDMRARVQRFVRDRTQTLAAISHDLRTPLTRLRLRAEDVADARLRRQLAGDVETMETMVQSALSFLRDQTTPAKRVTVDLPSLVQTVCDGFGDLGREVTFTGPPHLRLACDPDQVGRALTNLIDNALKFGTSASVRLREGSEGDLAIEIEDDGPGIPHDEKQRVFEPFYRSDAARSHSEAAGFGLGLAIARTIAEAHGGTLTLRDASPSGLVACFSLPARNRAMQDDTVK